MKYLMIADEGGFATYALIFDEGDEARSELQRFAVETGVTGAQLSGIGGASHAVLGWFDFEKGQFDPTTLAEQVEVVSLLGDIATTEDGKPQVHAHVVVAGRNARAHGGHLLELHVRPTLEVIVTETPTHLRKRSVPGLPVATISLEESS